MNSSVLKFMIIIRTQYAHTTTWTKLAIRSTYYKKQYINLTIQSNTLQSTISVLLCSSFCLVCAFVVSVECVWDREAHTEREQRDTERPRERQKERERTIRLPTTRTQEEHKQAGSKTIMDINKILFTISATHAVSTFCINLSLVFFFIKVVDKAQRAKLMCWERVYSWADVQYKETERENTFRTHTHTSHTHTHIHTERDT